MATEIALKAFRGNATMCSSGLASGKAQDNWVTGDELGRLHRFIINQDADNKVLESSDTTSYSHIEGIAVSNDGKYVAMGSNNSLNVCTLEDMMPSHPMALRCTLPITHVEFDSDSSHIFVASKEPDIRIFSMTTEEELKLKIATSEIGVRTFSLSPCGAYIAVVDEASNLVISKLVQEASAGYSGYNFVSRHSGVISRRTVVDAVKVGSQISWHPTELALAVPSTDGNMYVLRPDPSHADKYWKEDLMVTLNPAMTHKKTTDVNVVSFSKCGKLLLSADTLGTVVVWDYKAEDPLMVFNCIPANPLVSAAWGDNYILFVTSNHRGYIDTTNLKVVEDKVEEEETMDIVTSSSSSSSSSQLATSTDLSPGKNKSRAKESTNTGDKFLSQEDEDDIADVSVEQIKLATVGPRDKGGTTEGASQADDHDVDDDGGGDDDDDDDDDIVDANDEGQLLISNSETKELLEKMRASLEYKPQSPFQICSTTKDEKGRRYMSWNGVGSIVSREEAVNNRIEIRFSDVDGNNRPEAFPDNYGFVMAALSYEGAMFATSVDDNEDEFSRQGSTLYYHAFPNQDHLGEANESFTTHLPTNEAAVAVAAGRGWVAVTTSERYLRVFSSTGLQTYISFTKGEVVSIVGGDNQLAIFYHAGPLQYDGSSQINVEILEINVGIPVRQVMNDAVPLPNKAKLSWAGFEFDTGLLYIMSSTGLVSCLMKAAGWQWVPVYDSKYKKSSDYAIWPVTIKANRVCYVLLNGESKPAIYPQPVVANKPFRLPIAESKEGRDRGEAHNERARAVLWEISKLNHLEDLFSSVGSTGIVNSDELEERMDNQREITDKIIVKMLQDACKLQRDAVACDLAYRIRLDKSLPASIKVANHFGRVRVASTIQDIHDEREAKATLEEEQNSAYLPAVTNESLSYPGMEKENYANDEDYHDQPALFDNDEPVPNQSLGLSRKIASRTASSAFESPGVSCMDGEETDHEVESGSKQPPMAANPFARSCPASPPLKKTRVAESLSDMIGSPSPGDRKLNRQSSIALEARTKRLHDKRII